MKTESERLVCLDVATDYMMFVFGEYEHVLMDAAKRLHEMRVSGQYEDAKVGRLIESMISIMGRGERRAVMFVEGPGG